MARVLIMDTMKKAYNDAGGIRNFPSDVSMVEACCTEKPTICGGKATFVGQQKRLQRIRSNFAYALSIKIGQKRWLYQAMYNLNSHFLNRLISPPLFSIYTCLILQFVIPIFWAQKPEKKRESFREKK